MVWECEAREAQARKGVPEGATEGVTEGVTACRINKYMNTVLAKNPAINQYGKTPWQGVLLKTSMVRTIGFRA